MLTNEQIRRRLEHIAAITTLHDRVLNHIVRVGPESVTVRSERSGNEREISYDRIRRYSTEDGSIIDTLRRVLGLDEAEEEAAA
jgi:hypothetical protein